MINRIKPFLKGLRSLRKPITGFLSVVGGYFAVTVVSIEESKERQRKFFENK